MSNDIAQGKACVHAASPSQTAQWICRIAFALVFAVNVDCALSFCLSPANFAAAYELADAPGIAAVQGIGVAFLMWNATYPPVIAAPWRFRTVGFIVLAQQIIGLIGELLILHALPAEHTVLAGSIERFIAFDAVGLVIMVAACALLFVSAGRGARQQSQSPKR